MPFSRQIIAGSHVFEAQRSRKLAALGEPKYGTYNSERLCRFQVAEGRYGIVEAEIVKSAYGFSVRYASGLNNFDIIAGCRSGQLDGSLECAVRFAKEWQSAGADQRYVSMMTDEADTVPEADYIIRAEIERDRREHGERPV